MNRDKVKGSMGQLAGHWWRGVPALPQDMEQLVLCVGLEATTMPLFTAGVKGDIGQLLGVFQPA